MSTTTRHELTAAANAPAGCEQGHHHFAGGRCVFCGVPGRRRQRIPSDRFRQEYREMMRNAALNFRYHQRFPSPHDREIAAAFLCTAVMWRNLSLGRRA